MENDLLDMWEDYLEEYYHEMYSIVYSSKQQEKILVKIHSIFRENSMLHLE